MSTNLPQQSIDVLLQMANDPDKLKREESEKSLTILANTNFFLFLQNLGNILCDETKNISIRQLAAILIKNSLIYEGKFQDLWKKSLSPEQKNQIKVLVLSTLASSIKKIRTSAAYTIASICKVDSPIMSTWPDLLDSLTKNTFNNDNNIKLSAIETLGFVCEELNNKSIDSNNVDKIMNSLIQNLTNVQNSLEVVKQVLKALYYTIRLAEKNFRDKKECKIIMDAIFNVGEKYVSDEEVLEKIAMLFIEMLSISSYYNYLDDFINQIIKFSFNIIIGYKESNEKLALLALEILCTIGDEEVSRNKTSVIDVSKNENNGGYSIFNANKNYLSKIGQNLEKLIVTNVKVPEDDEDENEWTISKACLVILNLYIQTADNIAVSKFYKELANQIRKSRNNINEMGKYWLLLANSLNSYHKSDVFPIIHDFINIIFTDLKQNNSLKLKQCSSYLIFKITKIFPKIFEHSKLGSIINILTEEIKLSNQSSIIAYLCQSLRNIIMNGGDLETNKSSCPISQYFESISNKIILDFKTEIFNAKVNQKNSYNRLMTIGTLIDYSSHDKQVQIYEMIKHFLIQIESSQNAINDFIQSGVNKETVFQVQEYYYTLLQKLFNKYKTKIELSFAQKIWQLTEGLFKFRQTVFDEANLALEALAKNMGKDFTPIFQLYYPYIEYSIKSFSNTSLSKSGLISLLHCITSTENTIQKHEVMINLLMEVCTSNDVVRANKTIAINLLGEIVLFTGVEFKPYLEKVMALLFSAAKMGIGETGEEDEDIIDFIKNLRYELIQTFTCIVLTFNDNENNKELTKYIPSLFTFLESCVKDIKIQNIQILKSILNLFIDLFSIYQDEFKKLCSEGFVTGFIRLIDTYNQKSSQSDPDIEQSVDILKSYYRKF